jgi:hypothetical protein
LIAQETGAERGDVQASVVANALIGVHRSLVHYTRARILAGTPPPKLARDVRKQGERALAALERGLGDYGAR